MKAQKRNKGLQVCWVAGLLLAFHTLTFAQPFSSGKNLHDLQESVFANKIEAGLKTPAIRRQVRDFKDAGGRGGQYVSPVFLPRWSAESLPFFCRIEHNFAKNCTVPVKFRLGSVEYVDWLEGKTRFPAFTPQ